MTTVAEIFDKAERFFEVRVAQLLEEKRLKAVENGSILNARKAKRDARTAAGREKLDALVRRLADLAIIQERIIRDHCPDQTLVRNALEHHTRRLWLIQNAASSPNCNNNTSIAQLPPPPPSLVQQPPPPSLMLPLTIPHFHSHHHQPHGHPHQHPPPIFGHPTPVPQIMPASPYPAASIMIRQQHQMQGQVPSLPSSPPNATIPTYYEQVMGGAGTRALNPNADPWEAKPPSPRPSLPPPLPITPLECLFDMDDARYIGNHGNDEDMEDEDNDVTTPIFASTESVLQHLGPDFEDEMDEYSPCSILDIGSSPSATSKSQPKQKKLPFNY